MKKLLIVLALAGASLTGFAQNEAAVEDYSVATNSFWSNWFVQGGFDWRVWYSGQEHGENLPASPFKSFRNNFGGSIAVGKWFTPGLGLRTKFEGIWGKRVGDPVAGTVEATKDTGNKYWYLHEDVLFNLSNLICGYNPKRVWNFIPFLGGGFGRSMSRNFYGMGLNVGILNEFNIDKHWAANFELGWERMEGDVDGYDQVAGDRGWVSHDNILYAEVGVTYNFGQARFSQVPDIDAINAEHEAAIDGLNSKLRDAEATNSKLREALANQKPAETITKSVKELIATPISVFFNLDKIDIASQKDLVNVQALVKYAKENNRKILVTGYADSATGSAEHNQWLSEHRAQAVASEIEKMGVDSDNITTVGKGGVETLSPISFNRRATVQITD